MAVEVRKSEHTPNAVVIQGELAVTVPKNEVCTLVEELLPHADAECEDLIDRVTKALMPHISRQLREDGWKPRRNYPCGCYPKLLCSEHAAVRWDEFARRTGH